MCAFVGHSTKYIIKGVQYVFCYVRNYFWSISKKNFRTVQDQRGSGCRKSDLKFIVKNATAIQNFGRSSFNDRIKSLSVWAELSEFDSMFFQSNWEAVYFGLHYFTVSLLKHEIIHWVRQQTIIYSWSSDKSGMKLKNVK